MSKGEGSGRSKLDQFREAVQREFGRNLERATPANVREFLDRFQEKSAASSSSPRIVLNETKTTYEEILKDFFIQVLERPSEEAVIMLWTLAFEMSFHAIEQDAADRFQALFGDTSAPTEWRPPNSDDDSDTDPPGAKK